MKQLQTSVLATLAAALALACNKAPAPEPPRESTTFPSVLSVDPALFAAKRIESVFVERRAPLSELKVAGEVRAGQRSGAEVRPASVSIAETVRGTGTIERTLRRFPEVVRVVSRSGSPGVATDVMGIEQSDVFVIREPKSEWRSAPDREALVGLFERALERALPGTVFAFTQPIEMRVQELLGGMKSDIGVKIFGDDLSTLARTAAEIAQAIARVPGAADVRVEPTSGLPLLTVRPSPEKMGRLGVTAGELRAAIEALRAGRSVATFLDGNARFPVVVRLDTTPIPDPQTVALTPVTLADGRTLTLGDACNISLEDGPAQVSRELATRRVLIEANVRGRELSSFVHDLERALAKVTLAPGYYVNVSGQYENLVHAASRFAVIVPATLGIIFILLYLAFGRTRPALLIFLNIPVAASGGILALAGRGMPLSISAAVGFIALFGVATLNGVVLVSAARRHEADGRTTREAVLLAANERLRPVLTTAVVASMGFLPMALATGTGAEVQRPLATVVMGGLVTATLLTLALLPALYVGSGAEPACTNGVRRGKRFARALPTVAVLLAMSAVFGACARSACPTHYVLTTKGGAARPAPRECAR